MSKEEPKRLFIKVTRDTLPQVKDKYPYLYLERGRLEIDDASVMWIDCTGDVIRLPIATINTLMLGPGTSVTHEAIKVISSANCGIFWVGEDTLLFYAVGQSPTANTRNMKMQLSKAFNIAESLNVVRRMYSIRFPDMELAGKSLNEMMGMEGRRVRSLYNEKAEQYGVGWKGRRYTPNKFELSDITNQILTATNAALYGITSSIVHSLGFSPHIGFIHSGSPLPFVYDIADLYKDHLTIDLAFDLTLQMGGRYNKHKVANAFKDRVLQLDLMTKMPKDISFVLSGRKS